MKRLTLVILMSLQTTFALVPPQGQRATLIEATLKVVRDKV